MSNRKRSVGLLLNVCLEMSFQCLQLQMSGLALLLGKIRCQLWWSKKVFLAQKAEQYLCKEQRHILRGTLRVPLVEMNGELQLSDLVSHTSVQKSNTKMS